MKQIRKNGDTGLNCCSHPKANYSLNRMNWNTEISVATLKQLGKLTGIENNEFIFLKKETNKSRQRDTCKHSGGEKCPFTRDGGVRSEV